MMTRAQLAAVVFLSTSVCMTLLPTSQAHARRGMAVGDPVVSVGVKGAIGGASLASDGYDDGSSDFTLAYFVGAQARFALHELVVFQPELGLSSRGGEDIFLGSTVRVRYQYLHAPLLIGLTYTTGLPSELRPRLFVGPYLSYMLSGEGSVFSEDGFGNTNSFETEIEPGEDASAVDAGVVIGFGLDVDLGGFTLTSDLRIERGLVGLSASDRDVAYGDDSFHQVLSLNVGALFVF